MENEVLKAIKERRSIRRYKADQDSYDNYSYDSFQKRFFTTLHEIYPYKSEAGKSGVF